MTKRNYICDAERASIMDKFYERKGTLAGRPAAVYGRLNDFATVHALDGSCVHVEVAWSMLRRIVDSEKVEVRI